MGDRGGVDSLVEPFSLSLALVVTLGARSMRREGEGAVERKRMMGERIGSNQRKY